jgi:hypothetical protein
MRGEVVSDRTSDEEESRVEFAFSSLGSRTNWFIAQVLGPCLHKEG